MKLTVAIRKFATAPKNSRLQNAQVVGRTM